MRSGVVALSVSLVLVAGLVVPRTAHAACNLIPAAERTFPSTLGSVASPVTAPGKTVEIRLNASCDGSPGFDVATPANNVVTLTFEPPTAAGTTDVVVSPAMVTVPSTSTLRFVVPDTDADLPPADGLGLAGPARIRVRNPGNALLAEIGPLFEPTVTCDRTPEKIFRQLTVLPPANVFADLASGATTRILATVDGDRNVLVPFHYVALLPAGIGSPIARFLEGQTGIEAFTGGGLPIHVPAPEFVRSFTLNGRPLPPLLRVDGNGDRLFGTVDAAESVLRIARTDGVVPDLYDFTDRLSAGKGPIVIDKVLHGFAVTSGETVPLRGLRSSATAVAFARDESIEGDLNGDGDTDDRVVQLLDVQSGNRVNPDRAVVEVSTSGFTGLALEASGSLLAFLESEAGENRSVLNGDGDAIDSILRVFNTAGAHLTAAIAPTADPAPVVNGRSLVISGSLVFFRTREGDDTAHVTERVSRTDTGGEANGNSIVYSISADGRFVAFESDANNLVSGTNGPSLCVGGSPNNLLEGPEECDDGDLDNADGCDAGCHTNPISSQCYVYDRQTTAVERVSVNAAGEPADTVAQTPYMSADGRYVAFASAAANLVANDLNGVADGFVYDRSTDTIERVSVGAGNVEADGASYPSSVSTDGRFVVFSSLATNLAPGGTDGTEHLYVHDRTLHTTELVSVSTAAVRGDSASFVGQISADGRFVVLASLATNLVAGDNNGTYDVFVRDLVADTTERVSVNDAGVEGDGISLPGFFGSISGDGRFVVFSSPATNLVAGDTNGREDVFVFDRLTRTIERVSVTNEGVEADDDSFYPGISADGRVVSFSSYATNLVPGDGNGQADVFRYDRDTNTIERTSVASDGSESDGPSDTSPLSADGLHVAFVSGGTNLLGAGVDTNGTDDAFVRTLSAGPSLNADADLADTVLQAFDTATSQLRPAARVAASAVAIANQRAAVITPEASEGAADLNGDLDTDDGVAQLYDGLTNTVTSLGRAASRVAISSTLVAVTTPEAEQQGLDANGDSDAFDEVLAVYPIGGPPTPVNTGIAADALAVTGTTVVLTTPEANEGGTDLNGDLDATDRVLRVYDHTGPTLTEVGVAAEEFVLGGTLVAFRTSEAAQGNTDLNGDGDTLDRVMQVYDLASDTVISTGQAAILCTLPGCEPFTPYKIKGDTVSFLTREPEQGNSDLNGDGDALDVVAQIFHVRSGTLQVFDVSAGAPTLDPLPEQYIDGAIVYVEASEADRGEDLNGDGDQDDVVVLLAADADDDDTFDDFDTCVEDPNVEQQDSDLDGLGDTCDPTRFCGDFVPAAPVAAPENALACQKAAARAGVTYLNARGGAIRGCLNKIASGRLAGDPDGLCRGNLESGAEALPDDAKTAAKLVKAGAKIAATLLEPCPDQTVALLAACGATRAELAACVRERYGNAATAATDFAYGALGPHAAPVERTCQANTGKAATTYVKAVVKAMHGCLKRFNQGDLVGDGQALCLGSLGEIGVVLPTDPDASADIQEAEANLRAKLAEKCPGAELAALDACGGTPASAGDCLECTLWRRAVEAVRGVYGPG